MDFSDDTKWYVVQTAPRQEAVAARDLRRRGYETIFLHTVQWVGLGKSRARLVKRSWLPSYIFLGLLPEHFVGGEVKLPRLTDAATAIGVTAIVRAPGGWPLPIPSEAMEIITQGADPTGCVLQAAAPERPAWAAGNLVKLGDATPYWGFMGTIESIDPSGKLVILIESFGRSVRTTVNQTDVDELLSAEAVKCKPSSNRNLGG